MCTTTVLPHNTTTNSSFVYKFGNKSDSGSDFVSEPQRYVTCM